MLLHVCGFYFSSIFHSLTSKLSQKFQSWLIFTCDITKSEGNSCCPHLIREANMHVAALTACILEPLEPFQNDATTTWAPWEGKQVFLFCFCVSPPVSLVV